MHRAWGIHEIASSIIACIKEWELPDDEFMTDKSKKALAALARTCRVLSPIALDELWANPGDIFPILKCLPSDVWNEVKDRSVSVVVPSSCHEFGELKISSVQQVCLYKGSFAFRMGKNL